MNGAVQSVHPNVRGLEEVGGRRMRFHSCRLPLRVHNLWVLRNHTTGNLTEKTRSQLGKPGDLTLVKMGFEQGNSGRSPKPTPVVRFFGCHGFRFAMIPKVDAGRSTKTMHCSSQLRSRCARTCPIPACPPGGPAPMMKNKHLTGQTCV